MSSIDIRNEGSEEITKIVFAEAEGEDGYSQACSITKCKWVCDNYNEVTVNTKEQALNIIKALNKAIELGWVK